MAELAVDPAAFYRDMRLVAIDGSTFELSDDPLIEEAFGRPEGRQGRAGYPQARCVVLAECATHAILGAHVGEYSCCLADCFPASLSRSFVMSGERSSGLRRRVSEVGG